MAAEPRAADLQERADRLKEGIYVSFAALAVVLSLGSHSTVDATEALVTLAVTALGTTLAVFTADVVSHLVAHQRLMTGAEFRHAGVTTLGATGAVVLPLVLLAVAALGGWSTETALTASAVALLLSLIAFGYLAVRRIRVAWWQRILVLGGEAVLGLIVIALKLIAHG